MIFEMKHVISKKQDYFIEPSAASLKAQAPVSEFRSVKIRKDLFELLKLYCLCHRQNPREVVTEIVESRLKDFKDGLEELRKKVV